MAQKHYGLYYPYVQFRNESWLKLALLYWDHLARILPDGDSGRDSETVRALRQELGFVDDLAPSAEVVKIPASFLDLIQDYGLELIGRYHVSDGQSGLVQILVGDLSPRLHSSLIESRLAVDCLDAPGKLLVHPHLAKVYMTALAREVATRHDLHPVTDSRRDFVSMAGTSVTEIAQVLLAEENVIIDEASHSEPSQFRQVGYLAIETLLPKNLAALPLQSLVNFRLSFGRELAAFRETVSRLALGAGKMRDLDDDGAVEEQLEALFDRGLGRALTLLNAHLNQWDIETVSGSLAIQVPVFNPGQGAEQALSGDKVVEAAQGALAFSRFAIQSYASLERSPLLEPTLTPYLVPVEEWLKPRQLVQRVSAQAKILALR